MRRIILNIASSLDGYIAREDRSVDWLPTGGNDDFGMKRFMDSVDTVLLGRTTYEQILTFDCDYPYADKKSYVFSKNSKMENKDNVEFVSEIVDFSKKLVESPGKDIWLVGGAEIISVFLKAKLIDEIVLSMMPVAIGSGISLFKDLSKDIKFEILETIEYPGLTQLRLSIHNPKRDYAIHETSF
jgi:dihydrofolate reductase